MRGIDRIAIVVDLFAQARGGAEAAVLLLVAWTAQTL
jgi:hypothetical protein